MADKEVANNPDVIVWTSAFHENEVRRLLLWAAVAMRGLLDLADQKDDSASWHCGEYLIDFPDGNKVPLTFRQACNSIIHAKEILLYLPPEQDANTKTKPTYIDRIAVRGTHRSKTTRAQIDIVKLIQIADDVIRHFEKKVQIANVVISHFEGNDHANR